MSDHSRLLKVVAIAGVIVLTLALAVSANAVIVKTQQDHLVGTGLVQDIMVNCAIDLDNGVYTYSYSLQYLTGNGTGTINLFNVEDPDDVAYTDAWNSGNFLNSVYNASEGAYSVQWDHGAFTPGTTRTFSYKSIYGWRDINVYAYVAGGGIAEGSTLGMSGSAVPEPSSLAGLAMAGFAVIPVLRRRRK